MKQGKHSMIDAPRLSVAPMMDWTYAKKIIQNRQFAGAL